MLSAPSPALACYWRAGTWSLHSWAPGRLSLATGDTIRALESGRKGEARVFPLLSLPWVASWYPLCGSGAFWGAPSVLLVSSAALQGLAPATPPPPLSLLTRAEAAPALAHLRCLLTLPCGVSASSALTSPVPCISPALANTSRDLSGPPWTPMDVPGSCGSSTERGTSHTWWEPGVTSRRNLQPSRGLLDLCGQGIPPGSFR